MQTNGQANTLVGLIENKHLPPHEGHRFMIEWALDYLRVQALRRGKDNYHLWVMVCSRDSEIIPGELRFRWTQEMLAAHKHITVVHAHNVLDYFPEYGDDYGNHEMWGRTATEMLNLGRIDLLFASENYGPGIAAACGAKYIACDKDRVSVPVSGTEVRTNPLSDRCWEFLPREIRPFFAQKVCIYGAEWTGKSTLADHLVNYYRTIGVSEYSDKVYDHNQRACTLQDLEEIAACHIAAEAALLKQSNKLLLSDSDVLTTACWAEEIFGECPEWILTEANKRRYDIHLVQSPEGMTFRAGNTHKTREQWVAFHERLVSALESRGWPYLIISGDEMQRKQQARLAIERLRWDLDSGRWLLPERV